MTTLKIDINFYNKEAQEQVDNKNKNNVFFTFYRNFKGIKWYKFNYSMNLSFDIIIYLKIKFNDTFTNILEKILNKNKIIVY